MKNLLVIFLILFSSFSYSEVALHLPEGWSLSGSVIYRGNDKVGEVISKKSWPYSTGEDFITSFRNGFPDDPDITKTISSGNENGIFWVCRQGAYSDGQGGGGVWYARRFWVSGPIITFYSYVSCGENFDNVLKIAQSAKEQ